MLQTDAGPMQEVLMTVRRLGFSLVLLAALSKLAACGTGGPAHGPATPGVAQVVVMGFHSFDPPAVSIRAGETVEWRNTSVIWHTVTADPSLAKFPGDAAVPAGATPFHSGRVEAGEVYRHRFEAPGTYRYFCVPHEAEGMTGTVAVQG
jgi:plastocyanin